MSGVAAGGRLASWRERVVPDDAAGVMVAGVLLALAHPPFHLLVPSFVALVPFILWHERLPGTAEGRRQARIGGFFLGLVYYTLVFYWLFVALVYYTWLALLAFLAPILIMSMFLAWMSGAIHAVRRRVSWPIWLAFPTFWTANEWLRANLPEVGFPWMNLGDTLTGFPWLVGAADLVGSRGVSFWLVLVNALVASLWLGIRARLDEEHGRDTPEARRWRRTGLAVLAAVAFPIAYSLVRGSALEMRRAATVGVVQPNVPEHIKIGDPRLAADNAVKATAALVGTWSGEERERLDLVLIPETAIPLYIEPIPSYRGYAGLPRYDRWAIELAEALQADVLWGALGSRDLGGGVFLGFNSAFLTRPGQGRVARYDKRFLVPIVERVPFLPPEWFRALPYFGAFGVGAWGTPLTKETSAGEVSFGVMICYESIFSPLARHYRRNGADFLVNITNDAWFGRDTWWSRSSALWQHPAHLVMRAIETRMGVARSANTGVSEIVDPLGRVSRATPLFEPAAFVADVMTTDGRTVYVRFGDTVGWGSAIAAIFGLAAAILAARRSWEVRT